MRHLSFFLITFLFAFAIRAQKYGNEWINYSQKYYKIPIAKEGIYRIDSTTLASYYDLSTINPKNFQVFIKGKEQAIYIEGEGDNLINNSDFIEFYASPFMGDIDSLLYTDIKYMPNPYKALYNDTLYAFLTLNTSTLNSRYALETDVNFTGYTTTNYFYAEKLLMEFGSYNAVGEYAEGSSDPHLTQAEGRGRLFYHGNFHKPPVTGLNTYTASPLPFYVTVNYSGASRSNNYSPDHQVQLFYSDQNNTNILLSDTSFYGYVPVRKHFILNSQNTNNTTSVTFSCVAAPAFTNTGMTMWHYTYFFYPHTTNLNGQAFFKLNIDNSSVSGKSYFSFSNFNTSGSNSVILLDLTNKKRIATVVTVNQVEALVPNGSGKKWCILAAENDTIAVNTLIPVNQTGNFINYKGLAANNPYVLIYHKNLQSSAMSYKSYRSSAAGGSFDVIDADIESLYEQFSYGAKKHPVSIRHFIKFLNDSLANAPKYVLLIGKGIGYEHGTYSNAAINLVPTIGTPSSDNLLTTAISATATNTYYQEIPIGRLSAINNNEVTVYLDKVKKHEEPSPPSDWKKQILHFIGGDKGSLVEQLSGYMNGYKDIIKDTLFGGNVITVKKTTTAPVQNNISDSLKNVINRGASLINFFGHGSASGFDQAVDDPDMYNNKDRYPFVIANSCFSGDIHIPNLRSVSERFVQANQKGSIGFLATTSYGFPWNLNNYTSGFYEALVQKQYNQGIGDIIKTTTFKNSSGDIMDKLVAIDMTLSGDPAVKINVGLLPDYQIFNSDVSFDLKKNTDSVGIKFNFKNLGLAVHDTFSVRIERYFPNGDSVTVLKKVRATLYKDSLKHYFSLDFNKGIGLNKFRIMLDAYHRISEVSETNNTVGLIELFIPGGDVIPVYPYKYAVVPNTPTIVLKACTTDPFAPGTTYRFQLDTCDTFTSLLSTTLITSSGGVLEWKVNLPYKDSSVYFWRVSRDSTSPQKAFAWRESSFQCNSDKRGWSQAQFHQFKNNTYRYVNYKKVQRQFVFQNDEHSLQCRTGHYPALAQGLMNYFFDTELKEGWPSAFDGWNFAVFDSISGQPQQVFSPNFPNTGLGQFNNCIEHGSRYVYSFGNWSACGSPPTWKTDMLNFLNSIPPNNYVLGYTTGMTDSTYSQVSTYSNPLYTAFESVGAKNIRTTPDTVPYIFFGRKGMSAGQANTLIGQNKHSILYLEDSITTRWNTGYIASELIGPSYQWKSLHWRVSSQDVNQGDTSILKLVGIRVNGQIDTLATFNQDSADVYSLPAYINAGVHPYLKMVVFMKDNINRTSPQLQRWQVLYDEAPECAINPLKGFVTLKDTLQEGDDAVFRFPIENIGEQDFKDSLVITYWVENKDLIKMPLPPKLKAGPFTAGQIILDTVKVNTYQLKGNNALWIFVNPLNDPSYQHEQSQFNNIGRYAFNVTGDVTNPLLDVTFDGVRILNGDLVSAKPNILITLKDENKFLALNDTSAFTIFLQSPNQNQQRIYFGEHMQFKPASLPKNSCSINYNPVFGLDGKYMLIVQAKDRSMNASGAREYRVQFEVNTKPSVTQVLNYPNPFSTRTHFVFTLTGSEIPEVFTIQIMTITGKIVKEITRAELGDIHIGRNITEYAWDGRDNFGDRLANGVYLYRVLTKLNGQNIEKRTSGADEYFTKDFGKMVLMR